MTLKRITVKPSRADRRFQEARTAQPAGPKPGTGEPQSREERRAADRAARKAARS